MADETVQDVKQETQVEASASQSANSEASSTPVEQGQSANTESTTTAVPAEKSQAEAKKEERYVPLTELQRERQRRRDLERRLETLESTVAKAQEPNTVKELMEDLSVDEETARKLIKHGVGKKPEAAKVNEADKLRDSFIEEANDLVTKYDDWESLRQEMTEVFTSEASNSEADALRKGPEYYYLKAKLLRGQKESKASVTAVVDKANQKNLASTATGQSSTPRTDNKPKKGTRAWLKTLSEDDFKANHAYINAELARGGFKE